LQKKQVSRGKGARRDVPAPKPVGVPVPQRSDGPGPLPWRIVKAAVAFMGMMSLMVHTHLRDFLQNDTVDGWEMFCSSESWLTTAGRAEGLHMSRINLHQGGVHGQRSTTGLSRSNKPISHPSVVESAPCSSSSFLHLGLGS